MKKRKFLLVALCMTGVTACALGITACNTDSPAEHEHTYATTWSYDDDSHFHACTDENCTSIKDDAPHNTDGEGGACSECGYIKSEISAHSHTYGEWEVTTPATCTGEGSKTRSCECGDVQTETIPATGHTYGEWEVTTPATCTGEGSKTRSCECGDVQTETIYATGHTYGEWEVITPATCESDGEKTRSCACGDVQTETTTATGHAYGEWESDDYTSCGAEYTLTKTCANDHDHDHVQTMTLNGHFMESDVATGEKFTCPLCGGEYTYLYDQKSSDITTQLKAGDYYFEFSGSVTTPTAGFNVWMELALTAGEYEIDFEHLNGLNAAVLNITLHENSSDTTGTKIVSGSRTGGSVQAAFADVATIEHTSDKMQTLKFTFDATKYAGKFIKIQMQVQYAAKFNMNVKQEKAIIEGDNEVDITRTYEWVDEYKFVPTTEKTYSITVPEGVSVAVANKALDPDDFNYLTIILDASSFMEGEDCYADFTANANEPVYFVFNSAEKGNITATIGDEIGEKIPPILVLNEPYSINFADKDVVNTLTVGEDVPEGEYLITLKYYSVAAGRSFFYFTVNGDDMQTLGAGMSANGNYKDFAVIVTLKAGDVLVFTTNGGTASGKIDVTMSDAPTA